MSSTWHPTSLFRAWPRGLNASSLFPLFFSVHTQSIPIPSKFCFHFANAFEDSENGDVVVDLVQADFLMLDSDDDKNRPVWDSVGEKRREYKRPREGLKTTWWGWWRCDLIVLVVALTLLPAGCTRDM